MYDLRFTKNLDRVARDKAMKKKKDGSLSKVDSRKYNIHYRLFCTIRLSTIFERSLLLLRLIPVCHHGNGTIHQRMMPNANLFTVGSIVDIAPERRYGLPDSEGGRAFITAVIAPAAAAEGGAAAAVPGLPTYNARYIVSKTTTPSVSSERLQPAIIATALIATTATSTAAGPACAGPLVRVHGAAAAS